MTIGLYYYFGSMKSIWMIENICSCNWILVIVEYENIYLPVIKEHLSNYVKASFSSGIEETQLQMLIKVKTNILGKFSDNALFFNAKNARHFKTTGLAQGDKKINKKFTFIG